MHDDVCRQACLLIQKIMSSYISGEPEKIRDVMEYISPDILVIGTGKHEFYQNLNALRAGLKKDQQEAEGINFIIENEWYEAKLITDDVCLVYGEFKACETNIEGKRMIIHMDTRITASLHCEPDGRMVVDSLHHSVPYLYQREGEYYPKTFADQAEEAMKRSAVLERDIQLDPMTGILNRKFMEKYVNRMLEHKTAGTLFLIDLDDFKKVNDIQGHQAGDKVLKQIAKVLQGLQTGSAAAGRMGGDEFMLFCPDLNKSDAEKTADQLIRQTGLALEEMELQPPQSCSVGLVSVDDADMTFEEAYGRADEALYKAKAQGKGRYCWYDFR
ncbi:GGDEF domain-containing protein [Ihubacter massiliensis]|uniref:GGDEF domain-containing protein n=1 Tax=Hominibacterium faecale TaxID=2839743 RepID=A0A9J6QUC2_9FIRM|nr:MULTISPECIES: diguanylate cyclase [Eubacteriales Family XIII. Incertae Sedis]MCI7300230.1 GGDEF domain-containing protein [Clostridia bacterium]MCO7121496.1 GGDEF domain-containing protein [Ihubacter massiliensis]MCU7378475.1 GGDEF domain-containing protein [Hominibacterium faecale]MDY3010235.1 diguanylate cyclase [Clostridiales Family XIII bacterium]